MYFAKTLECFNKQDHLRFFHIIRLQSICDFLLVKTITIQPAIHGGRRRMINSLLSEFIHDMTATNTDIIAVRIGKAVVPCPGKTLQNFIHLVCSYDDGDTFVILLFLSTFTSNIEDDLLLFNKGAWINSSKIIMNINR